MRLPKIVLMLTVTSFLLAGCTSVGKNAAQNTSSVNTQSEEKPQYQASFLIYTDGLKRNFTNPMYHNKSEDVFIETQNPNIIKGEKGGVTWNDFFKTLQMNLTADCLTTGTGQVFCTGEAGSLQFYVNGERAENFLEREISAGDKALITYGNQSQDEIADQIKSIPNPN